MANCWEFEDFSSCTASVPTPVELQDSTSNFTYAGRSERHFTRWRHTESPSSSKRDKRGFYIFQLRGFAEVSR